MARYQAILAYDGTDFFGYQRQRQGRTVQGVLEEALHALGWAGRTVLAAGRTDRGVHAAGQVIAFDLDWDHHPADLQAALNAGLPADMSIRTLRIARPEFHPRYDARARCYVYQILEQPVRDPLRERYAWRVWPVLDRRGLDQATARLIGRHDFAAFGKPMKPTGGTWRTIREARWQMDGDLLQFRVVADAFLHRMVRRIVHLLVVIGHGRFEPDVIAEYLQNASERTAQGLAPPHGLILTEVTYGKDILSEG